MRDERARREIRRTIRERKREPGGWTIDVGGRSKVASKLVRSELRFI